MDAQATNNLIAGVSVAIAIFAFVVSALTLRAQRTHNELSARPIVDATFGRDERLIELVNCGLGPALITVVRAQVANTDFDLMDDDGLEGLANYVVGVIERRAVVTPLRLVSPSPLLPNQSKPLLSLRHPFTPEELDRIRTQLKSVSLTVEFDCMYQKSHRYQHKAAPPI